jgi:hypothetical protein
MRKGILLNMPATVVAVGKRLPSALLAGNPFEK